MYFLQLIVDIFYFTNLYASLQTPLPKLCKNCKYFIPDDPWFGVGKEFGKCKLFQEVVTRERYNAKPEYNYCSVARNNKLMCGREGKFYKRKQRNFYFYNA